MDDQEARLDDASRSREPRYLGGQAVLDGVMMRGLQSWSVAVRAPDGSINVVVHDAPGWTDSVRHIPLVRGVVTLAESLTLGMKALTWSSDQAIPEDEKVGKGAMGVSLVVAFAFFIGVFVLLPLLGARFLADALSGQRVVFHIIEAALSLSIFVGYLALIGRIPDIRRVFEYHGAEHKAIAAYENGAPLTPESADRFTTAHVRCGTNFLLTVMVIAILVHAVVGRPALPILIGARIISIPIIAGLAYEIIRFAASHQHWGWVRALTVPGLTLQKLTTRPPSPDQLEVAIAAVQAVLTDEQRAEVDAR
ncbi:MAG: DUF1385 domain-containing protein [Acidimicrobiia bacterium]